MFAFEEADKLVADALVTDFGALFNNRGAKDKGKV